MFNMMSLPFEIILAVFDRCLDSDDIKGASAFRILCRRTRDIVDDSELARHRLALCRQGMRMGFSGTESVQDQAIALARYVSAMHARSRYPRALELLPFGEPSRLYCYRDGHLVLVRDNMVHLWRLPSPLRGVTLKVYTPWPLPPRLQSWLQEHSGDMAEVERVLIDPGSNTIVFVAAKDGPRRSHGCATVVSSRCQRMG